jgi:hypothetical protein
MKEFLIQRYGPNLATMPKSYLNVLFVLAQSSWGILLTTPSSPGTFILRIIPSKNVLTLSLLGFRPPLCCTSSTTFVSTSHKWRLRILIRPRLQKLELLNGEITLEKLLNSKLAGSLLHPWWLQDRRENTRNSLPASDSPMSGVARKSIDGSSAQQSSAFLLDPLSKPAPAHEYTDVVDRGLVTADMAATMFNCYVEQMAPHMPAVVFDAGTTSSAEVRKTKPTLFLAILAASSGSNFPDIQKN